MQVHRSSFSNKIGHHSPGDKASHSLEVPLTRGDLEEGHSHFHSHSHCHHHPEKSADILSNLGALGEGVASASSNYYWGTSFASLASNLIWGVEVSMVTSRVCGFGFAALAVGSLYAHRQLNAYHQQALQKSSEDLSCSHIEDSSHQNENQVNLPKKKIGLNVFQQLSLVADYFAHTGDVSGAITAGVEEFLKSSPDGVLSTNIGKASLFLGATLVGAVTAVGNVRSCRHAMMEQNK